jgi:hypothetical protein
VLAIRRRPHPRAAGPSLGRRSGRGLLQQRRQMWPCECRAARAAGRRRRARSVRQLVACRPRRTSYRPGRSGAAALGGARTFRQHRRRDRLPSRASCRIYILSGSRPPHRLPRWQDRHVHLAHDRYYPCRCGQCAFPKPQCATSRVAPTLVEGRVSAPRTRSTTPSGTFRFGIARPGRRAASSICSNLSFRKI